MKNARKLAALLLALAMASSAAACSSPSESGSQANEGTSSAAQADGETSGGEESQEPATKLTLFVDESWWPYDTWEGAIPEEFNKRANVEIEVTRAADDNQLTLMVASGDMTDLVCSWRYQHMAKEGVSYAFDTLHEEYPDVDFPVDPVTQFVNTMADGHYYTIGCGFSPASEVEKWDQFEAEGAGFIYRTDIAEELGISFETLDDLDAAFAAVKEAYPEMSPTSFNCIHKFGWLRNMMGLPGSSYYEKEDGTLGWYIEAPGQLDYYKKVNEWYRNGYILPDNFAYQSEDDSKQLMLSGKAFSTFSYDNHADNYNTEAQSSGIDFSFSLQIDPIGENAAMYSSNVGGRGVYITKSCQNVEKAYETVAYMYGDEGMKLLMWGIEGEDYTLNEDNYPVFNYNFQGDNSVLQPRGLKYWGWLVHNEIVTGIADVTSDTLTAKARVATGSILVKNPVLGLIRFETDSEESVISSKLSEMIKAEEINVYMAESEEACEAAYNAMIEKANSIGMQTLVEYGNSLYPDLKAQYDEIVAGAE